MDYCKPDDNKGDSHTLEPRSKNVEPKGFLKNTPILKSFEKDDVFYSVTFIRQFENASVVEALNNSINEVKKLNKLKLIKLQ